MRAREALSCTEARRAQLTRHNPPLRTPSPSYESSYQALGWVLSTPHLLLIFTNHRMIWILLPPFQKEKAKARELN